jgi:hypothetical protein
VTDNLRPDHRAALACPAGGALDQLPLESQQLRGREPVNPQAAVVSNPDGPLGQEPVGRHLDLGDGLLGRGATGSRLARASTTSVRVKVDTGPVSPSGPASPSSAASSSVRVAGRPRPPEHTSTRRRSPTPCSANSAAHRAYTLASDSP